MSEALLRAIIVDDEPLARNRVAKLLGTEPDVQVLAECGNGAEAVKKIAALRPNVLFLDVEMPELNGFQVLDVIDARDVHVVFVTAYDHYAIRAFDVHAADYLLKPFDRERFAETVARIRTMVTRHDGQPVDYRALLRELQTTRSDRILVKTDGKLLVLEAAAVDWIEAKGNYARIHASSETYLVRESMNALEERLDPAHFARVHRSTIVNLARIKELRPLFHGEYTIILHNGARLTLSRGYRDSLKQRFGEI